ncbi:hypothetical protein [Kamptonema formosum]|uniref:hypothetical protein n=1 Tax=Kamptonema formosum TaxID=331992 RepID=UPI0003497EC4|nr:hypothetical protein [Oscillatoria sp. PCC 10802]
MENKLTQAQLDRVIAEVQRLSLRREAELDRQQVQEILQELNLSPDLLDEALVQIQRREALSVRQRRNRWIVAGVTAALIGAIATATVFVQHRQQVLARVSTYESRIALDLERGENVSAVDRQSGPTVFYRVTLSEAPVGEKLSLSCDWTDPSGRVAHQNRYQTREIDRAVWPTYCYYQLGPNSAAGTWQVRMFLDGRTLTTSSFVVK